MYSANPIIIIGVRNRNNKKQELYPMQVKVTKYTTYKNTDRSIQNL